MRRSTSKPGPARSPARNRSSPRRRTGSPSVRRPARPRNSTFWFLVQEPAVNTLCIFGGFLPLRWIPLSTYNSARFDLLSSAVPEAFELSTERRARERQELERLACEREAELAMLKEEERRREEQQEKEEIARMRQEQVSRLRSAMRAFPLVAIREN